MVFEARAAGISVSTASITPQRMPMSRLPRSDWLGSSTSPPLITRSNLSFGPIAALAGVRPRWRMRPIPSAQENYGVKIRTWQRSPDMIFIDG